jgi:hypothetical protein
MMGQIGIMQRWYVPYVVVIIAWLGIWALFVYNEPAIRSEANPYPAVCLNGFRALLTVLFVFGIPTMLWARIKIFMRIEKKDLILDTADHVDDSAEDDEDDELPADWEIDPESFDREEPPNSPPSTAVERRNQDEESI